jgi:hypothetical protein
MEMADQKRAFVYAWLQDEDGDAFGAALKVFGADTSAALRYSHEWSHSDEVLKLRDEVLAEYGEEAFLPTKGDAVKLAWKMAQTETVPVRERVAALALFSELRGFVSKGGTNVTIDNSVKSLTSNVMQVPMPASIDEWQEKAKFQQRQLVENARSTH